MVYDAPKKKSIPGYAFFGLNLFLPTEILLFKSPGKDKNRPKKTYAATLPIHRLLITSVKKGVNGSS